MTPVKDVAELISAVTDMKSEIPSDQNGPFYMDTLDGMSEKSARNWLALVDGDR